MIKDFSGGSSCENLSKCLMGMSPSHEDVAPMGQGGGDDLPVVLSSLSISNVAGHVSAPVVTFPPSGFSSFAHLSSPLGLFGIGVSQPMAISPIPEPLAIVSLPTSIVSSSISTSLVAIPAAIVTESTRVSIPSIIPLSGLTEGLDLIASDAPLVSGSLSIATQVDTLAPISSPQVSTCGMSDVIVIPIPFVSEAACRASDQVSHINKTGASAASMAKSYILSLSNLRASKVVVTSAQEVTSSMSPIMLPISLEVSSVCQGVQGTEVLSRATVMPFSSLISLSGGVDVPNMFNKVATNVGVSNVPSVDANVGGVSDVEVDVANCCIAVIKRPGSSTVAIDVALRQSIAARRFSVELIKFYPFLQNINLADPHVVNICLLLKHHPNTFDNFIVHKAAIRSFFLQQLAIGIIECGLYRAPLSEVECQKVREFVSDMTIMGFDVKWLGGFFDLVMRFQDSPLFKDWFHSRSGVLGLDNCEGAIMETLNNLMREVAEKKIELAKVESERKAIKEVEVASQKELESEFGSDIFEFVFKDIGTAFFK